jgi:deazaflavin-dependent oxidoreductase (nitroreductase family)
MTTRRSPRLYWLIGRIGTSRVVTRIHPPLYRLTGGRWLLGRNFGVLNVIVTTVGRRSGRVREVPLYAFEDGDRLVVVGSCMGRPEEPAWVGNLVAHPEATVRVGRDVRAVRARIAEGGERDRLWALAVGGYPGYEDYARWTTRRIPVVVLEPLLEPVEPVPEEGAA